MSRDPSPEVMEIVKTIETSPTKAAKKLGRLARKDPNQIEVGLYYSIALRLQGKFTESEQALNKIIERYPNHALAYQELGVTLSAARQMSGAVEALEKAIKLDPNLPLAWQVYADLMTRLGRNDVAQKARQQSAMAQAASQRAQVSEMELDGARDLLSQGNTQQAEAICRALLAQTPSDVEALCLLASVRLKLGASTEALNLLEKCIEIEPNHLLSRVTLASTFQTLFEFEEASKHLRVVDAAATDDPNVILLRSKIHFDNENYDAALEGYADLLTRFERIPTTLVDYGLTLRAIGRKNEAITAFREAEELDPGRGMPWFSLANLKVEEFDDEDIRRMRGYLGVPDVQAEDRLLLSFALGKALEDRGDWDGAFVAFDDGNKAQRQVRPFRAASEHQRLEAIWNHFDSELVNAHDDSGCPANDPIFVLGLPRSGSTLVEQILASHSLVEGTFELPELHNITKPLWDYGPLGELTNYCDFLAEASNDTLTAMGQDYIRRTQVRRTGNVYFVDKLLGNFVHVGLIKLILPNAKIIEVRKSPMAHCFSMWKHLFPSGVDFSYDLEQLGNYYCDYIRLMEHWHSLFPNGILSVSYEKLVSDTDAEVRAILDHCGLDFEDACLEPHLTQRVVRTASSEQVRQPIYDSAIDHWKHFEPHLEPLKIALGPVLK